MEMSKREREEETDVGGVEKRKKINTKLNMLIEKAIEMKDWGEFDAYLRSESEKNVDPEGQETASHSDACLGYDDTTKALIQYCLDIYSVTKYKWTLLAFSWDLDMI